MEYKKYKDITYRIIGAAMVVHRELGSGLLNKYTMKHLQ